MAWVKEIFDRIRKERARAGYMSPLEFGHAVHDEFVFGSPKDGWQSWTFTKPMLAHPEWDPGHLAIDMQLINGVYVEPLTKY